MPSPAEALRRLLLPREGDTPEPVQGYDVAIEWDKRQKELEAEWEARREAEAEAARPPKTTAEIVHENLTGAPMPLNGADILRAALGGGHGTINGGTELESITRVREAAEAVCQRRLSTLGRESVEVLLPHV